MKLRKFEKIPENKKVKKGSNLSKWICCRLPGGRSRLEEAVTDAIARSGRPSIKTCSADCQKSSQFISAATVKN